MGRELAWELRKGSYLAYLLCNGPLMLSDRHIPVAIVAFWLLVAGASAHAADWISAPSYYSHDPATARRVAQFSPIGPFYVYNPPNYTRSGYRHMRSTIQAGGSADNLHIVEEWGRPVVPYEQWRFPFRPYGSPYPDWGPPFAGATFVPGFGPVPGPWPGPGHGGYVPAPSPYYQMQGPAPWLDGHWPTYRNNDRSGYFEPYGRGRGE